MTPSEARLWSGISRKATGARFRRQVPIGRWIVDFASYDPRLVIEVDDTSHYWRDETERTEYLKSLGFTLLRFDNREIAMGINEAIATVATWVADLRAGRDPEG